MQIETEKKEIGDSALKQREEIMNESEKAVSLMSGVVEFTNSW